MTIMRVRDDDDGSGGHVGSRASLARSFGRRSSVVCRRSSAVDDARDDDDDDANDDDAGGALTSIHPYRAARCASSPDVVSRRAREGVDAIGAGDDARFADDETLCARRRARRWRGRDARGGEFERDE